MWAYLCACAGCGYSLPPVYYLCERCWNKMTQQKAHFVYDHHRWPTYTLWEWKDKKSLLHDLLRRRKGCNISKTEWHLALWLVDVLPLEIRDSVDGVVYPSKGKNEKDHTRSLAHAVGEILDLPTYAVEIPSVSKYKSFGRHRRAKERSKKLDSYTLYKGKMPLMVDDIITTGATLNAVWRSLGSPQYTVALCLAYKTFNPVDKI